MSNIAVLLSAVAMLATSQGQPAPPPVQGQQTPTVVQGQPEPEAVQSQPVLTAAPSQPAPTAAPSPIAPAAPQSRPAAPPPPPPDPVIIPMELLANRPIVRLMINGQGPFPFLLAPEDQASLIDKELADTLKIKQPVVELGVASGKAISVAITVTDLAKTLPQFALKSRPRGVVSLSAWEQYLVTIDYARWRVTLEPGTLPEPNGKDVFALTESRQLRLPLSIGEQSVECHVDPLFPEGLLLPASYGGHLPIDGTAKDWGWFNTKEGTVSVREVRLATSLMLGPFELKAPVVLLAEGGQTATVGTRWLGRFSVTYDLARGRARLDSPARVDTAARE